MPYEPTEQELKDAVKHLEYEWKTLCLAAVWLAEHHPQSVPFLTSAAVQSFAIQFRNPTAFFFDGSRADDDVQARMYASNWNKSPSDRPPLIQTWLRRANKQVSHLSFTRATTPPEDFQWPFVEILVELSDVCKQWQAEQNWGDIDIGNVPPPLVQTLQSALHAVPGIEVTAGTTATTPKATTAPEPNLVQMSARTSPN